MSKKRRGILWLARICGLLLFVLGCFVFPVVRRHQNTAHLVQAVLHTDAAGVHAALANGSDPNAFLDSAPSFTLEEMFRILFHRREIPESGETVVMYAAGNSDGMARFGKLLDEGRAHIARSDNRDFHDDVSQSEC